MYKRQVFYFIDNEYYFKRSGLYGFYDDGERFAFFSRAILEMLFYTDFEPDIINCNDWQTALTPVYLNLYYRHLDKFSRIKTVFTIHNIAYQGKYGLDILEDTCGIGARDAHVVEYDGCANFMKGAIETADKVTTVSPTYAQEILDPWFSHGLDGLLRQKQYKLCGILNGIDVDVFNPATDPDIVKNYDADTFQDGKAACKAALQDKFGLHKDGSPVMAMVTRLVGHKGVDLVQAISEEMCIRDRFKGYAARVSDMKSYFDENMRLLQDGSMDALFGPAPIYTKIRDDNPTRYVAGSSVKNSLLADGCVIEGTVENCVLFRGCQVKKGAVVKNCVLMQDTVVETDCGVEYVVTDKNVHITAGKKLAGTDTFPVFVAKNHSV